MTDAATPDHAFSHVGVCVSDLDASLRFYCEGLGFEPSDGFDLTDELLPGLDRALEVPGPVAVRSQMITRGPIRIELLAYGTPAPTGAPSTSRGQLGLTHLTFSVGRVEDVDALAAHLVACGGTVLADTNVDAGIRILFLTDPDGTRVELLAM